MSEITDFNELQLGIEHAIKARFPRLNTVALMRTAPDDTIKTPAVLLEVSGFTGGKKVSGGRLALRMTCQAHCMLSIRSANVEREIVNMAAAVAALVEGNHWGLPAAVQRPENIEATPGEFSTGEAGFESWVVSWEQLIHLGAEWQPPDDMPERPSCPDHPGGECGHRVRHA
ncbi:MAG: hypothetical protein ACRDCY_21965 [Aeromonas veronii]